MGSFTLSHTHQTYSYSLSLEWNLKPVNQELLVSNSEVICLIDFFRPLKVHDLAITSPLFASITPCSPLFCL